MLTKTLSPIFQLLQEGQIGLTIRLVKYVRTRFIGDCLWSGDLIFYSLKAELVQLNIFSVLGKFKRKIVSETVFTHFLIYQHQAFQSLFIAIFVPFKHCYGCKLQHLNL